MRGKKIAKPVVALAPAPEEARRIPATREIEQVTPSPIVERPAVPSEVVGYPLDHSALKQYGLVTRA